VTYPRPAIIHLTPSDVVPRQRRGKTIAEIPLALLLGLLTLPLVLSLALVSALSFRAWPFFCQDRVGRDGKSFRFVKIRSLAKDVPADADKYTIERLPNTRFGSFIRRTHVDELPQLWLVVVGRMSLVGPRPEMPVLASTFDPAFVAVRTTVRPGCTGFWQVSAGAGQLIGEAPEYDLFYISHGSLRFDLWILWRTLWTMAGGQREGVTCPPLWVLWGEAMPSATGLRAPVPQVVYLDVARDQFEGRVAHRALAGELDAS
jgi:lipopolysaccharide/colanic/teichoic acid biosynthesis glycosyltransferase